MILSLIVIVAVAGVAAFHYKQGLFSSTITAMLSAIAAVIALGLNDFAATLLKGAIPELANAVLLVGVYALVYLILRVIFDALITTKVEVPPLADKIGGALAGAIAGMFAAGVFVLAFQMLPFGPVILGYSRLDTVATPTPAAVKGGSGTINTPLKSDKLDEVPRHGLIIPVDDMVAGLTSHLSSGGALAGSQSMAVVHPAFIDELFLQRVGIQAGANRVALNITGGAQGVSLNGLFAISAPIPVADGEIKELANNTGRWSVPKLDPQLKVPGGSVALVARLTFTSTPDPDGNIRLSPGTIRLSAGGRNYFPIGAIDWVGGPILRMNRPDDFLILPGGGKADFVYMIPSDDLGGVTSKDAGKIGPDVAIVARRLGLIDLSGKPVQPGLPPPMSSGESTIIRKAGVHPELKGAAVANSGASPAAVASGSGGVLEEIKAQVSTDLPIKINLDPHDGDTGAISCKGGSGQLKEGKIAQISIDPGPKPEDLSQGTNQVTAFWVAPDQQMIQVSAQVPSQADLRWQWAAKIMQFELVTAAGSLKPRGVWAELKKADGTDTVVARLNSEDAPLVVTKSEATPTKVILFFVAPANSALQELKLEGKTLAPLGSPGDSAAAPAPAAPPAGQ